MKTKMLNLNFNSVDSISLLDFKENINLDPDVNYRFFFKSQEPEFGYLKEEVIIFINIYLFIYL